jgi:phospholipid/cholesterol/gamma-HCH transport system permease protein
MTLPLGLKTMPELMTSAESVTLHLEGRITAQTATPIWRRALGTLASNPDQPVVIDTSHLEHVDTVGIALLFDLGRQTRPAGAGVTFQALPPSLASLLYRYDAAAFGIPLLARRHVGVFEHVGRSTISHLRLLRELLNFLRLCWRALMRAVIQPGTVAWTDVLDVATEVGAHAVPIVLLVGFLMGVIIAFEVGLVAQQFGATLVVVDGVGKAMLRELGALMTAIVLAGRTGAAFAAQIATQRVNEELNAISTFGLDPIEFLVVPRLLAAVVVVPLLAVSADVIGLFGGALVMASKFDVSYLQFYSQLLKAVTAQDFMLGIVKAAVFGLTIAAIGCHRGFRSGAGPASVGLSATGAVVASIVTVVVIDGLFAVMTS